MDRADADRLVALIDADVLSEQLIEKLEANARFYENEAVALAEAPDRRDRRRLGAQEARTISELLRDAAAALRRADAEIEASGG